ncbi:hypothetical protein E2C01_088356 [Portunus trituberculatus]|uniref:Uncharacterized protein n=1 Tax=Portunus trituberculatus TaxID=210409 RepID=A0A5B7JFR6_PORTR|nr:hypothetical protein [Portunus trituberculatus]
MLGHALPPPLPPPPPPSTPPPPPRPSPLPHIMIHTLEQGFSIWGSQEDFQGHLDG